MVDRFCENDGREEVNEGGEGEVGGCGDKG